MERHTGAHGVAAFLTSALTGQPVATAKQASPRPKFTTILQSHGLPWP